MLKPLEEWICDVCGEVIKGEKEGYVVYHMTDPPKNSFDEGRPKRHGFKIIHKSRCDHEDEYASLPLSMVTGNEGLAKLQSWISKGPASESESIEVKSTNEYVDFFRRVQLPYYEEARQIFGDKEVRDWSEYAPENMRRLIEKKRSCRRGSSSKLN
jgi:hypothetical protein